MIKRNDEYSSETRSAMRGGDGEVHIERLWEPETEMKADNRLFARMRLEPGASIGFHRHDGEEEVFYILRGEAEADDDGVKTRLLPGDTILTGGGAGHSIKSLGDEPLEILAVISKHHNSE